MSEIVIKAPTKRQPGYLKRTQARMEIEQRLRTGDPKAVTDMVKFITEYAAEITVPPGVSAEDALYSLSEEEFFALMRSFNGSEDTVPSQSGG